jgi:hypothetical protein
VLDIAISTWFCYVWRGTAYIYGYTTRLVLSQPVLLERNTIMNFTFTPDQAAYAQEVAIDLFKTRRFFLPVNRQSPMKYLPEDIFSELYKLDKMFEDQYHFSAKKLGGVLLNLEAEYGLKLPQLKDGQNVVECKRYSGGLEIIAIVPLQALMAAFPVPHAGKAQELLKLRIPAEKIDQITPRDLREIEDKLVTYSIDVDRDLRRLISEFGYTTNDKVVVVLGTRFNPCSYNEDFMEGKLDGLVTYPNLLSYLLFKAALAGVFLSKSYFTIFNSSRKGHVELVVDSKGEVKLYTNATQGYDCTVSFATIL